MSETLPVPVIETESKLDVKLKPVIAASEFAVALTDPNLKLNFDLLHLHLFEI